MSATAAMAVVSAPAGRSGLRISSSLTTPATPAAAKATPTARAAGSPSDTLASQPAKAPMVRCEAMAKFGKRRTA